MGHFQRRAAQLRFTLGIIRGPGVKYASENTVYSTNTDLSFIENFTELTEIYGSEALNAPPLTHDSVL